MALLPAVGYPESTKSNVPGEPGVILVTVAVIGYPDASNTVIVTTEFTVKLTVGTFAV